MSLISDEDYRKKVCTPGIQGDGTACRYLAVCKDGWECLKESSLKPEIDRRGAAGTMKSKGDNCKGFKAETENKK